jgi:hypothetical protein
MLYVFAGVLVPQITVSRYSPLFLDLTISHPESFKLEFAAVVNSFRFVMINQTFDLDAAASVYSGYGSDTDREGGLSPGVARGVACVCVCVACRMFPLVANAIPCALLRTAADFVPDDLGQDASGETSATDISSMSEGEARSA